MAIWEDFKRQENKATIILCGINILVFVGLTLFGMTEDAAYMLKHGAMYVPYVIENQEYYRLFTSMFLHFGIQHLGSNMLLLYCVGSPLELEMGKVKYIILYLVSGLLGNVLSMMYSIKTMDYAVSGGASGAIFGVVGAMIWVAIRHKGEVRNLTSRGLLFIVALTLYSGFTSTGIDNLAHIGGLVSGFILALFIYRKTY